ncbi:MAG: transglutaminaseTgpA domain-containing protein, partial [Pseudoclavibacter sp.]
MERIRRLPRLTARGWAVLAGAAALWVASGALGAAVLVIAVVTGVGLLAVALVWVAAQPTAAELCLSGAEDGARDDAEKDDAEKTEKTRLTVDALTARPAIALIRLPVLVRAAAPPADRRWTTRRTMVRLDGPGRVAETSVPAPTRGLVSAGPVRLGTLDPWHLAVRWTAASEAVTVPVLPTTAAGPHGNASQAATGIPQPAAGRPGPDRDDDPAQLREWRAGDSLSRVHWLSSARRGRLQTRESRPGGRPAADLELDGAAGAYADDRQFEVALARTASAAHALQRDGSEVRLWLRTDEGRALLAEGDGIETALAGLVRTPGGVRPLDGAERHPARHRRRAAALPVAVAAPARLADPARPPQGVLAQTLLGSAAAGALTAGALFSWRALFAGTDWLDIALWAAGGTWAAAVAVLALGRRRWTAPPAIGALILAIGVATARSGFGWRSWTDGTLIAHVVAAVQSGTPPVPADPALSLVIGSVLGAAGAAGALLFAWWPPLGALPALLILSIPETVLGTSPDRWAAPAIAVALIVLFAPRNAVPLRPQPQHLRALALHPFALRALAAGAVLALAVTVPAAVGPPSLRALGLDPALASPLQGGAQGPLATLGADLRQGQTTVVLRHIERRSGDAYLTLATLDDFTGTTWRPDSQTPGRTDISEPPDAAPAVDQPGQPVDSEIEIAGLASSWLPLPEGVQRVRPADGGTVRAQLPLSDWRWVAGTASAHSAGSTLTQRGQRYAASGTALRAGPDLEAALRWTLPDGDVELTGSQRRQALSLPRDVPASFVRLADTISTTADPADWGTAAVEYFTSGSFAYSETAPVEDGFDGTGIDAVQRFLRQRSGYCVHYAAAMALLARAHGIPARIAIGYRPGTLVDEQGRARTYEVTNRDLHAWPQLFVDGVGWVSFEPTPGMTDADEQLRPGVQVAVGDLVGA